MLKSQSTAKVVQIATQSVLHLSSLTPTIKPHSTHFFGDLS